MESKINKLYLINLINLLIKQILIIGKAHFIKIEPHSLYYVQ